MLTENTINKLYEMRLNSMAQTFRNQLTDNTYTSMLFEERFGLLVDSEWSRRRNNRLTLLIKKADYVHPRACTEDINYAPNRHLDKGQIARLSLCNYIQDSNNIIILGATGTGKSYLSCVRQEAINRIAKPVKPVMPPNPFWASLLVRACLVINGCEATGTKW